MISLLYDSILAFLGAVMLLYDSMSAFLGGDHSFTIHLSAFLGGDHSFTIHLSAFLGGCSASSRGPGGRILAILVVCSTSGRVGFDLRTRAWRSNRCICR